MSTPPAPATRATEPTRSSLALLAGSLLALLGFLPIADWIPGGHSIANYPALLSEWASGTAIALGGGLVLAILLRRAPARLTSSKVTSRLTRAAERRPTLAGFLLSTLALLTYVTIARLVFSTRPLFVDEIIQLFQAGIFADGRLWQPAAPHPEFFSILQVVDQNGRVFSQFPPGGPAFLALGVLLDAPWLVNPLCAAIAVYAYWSYLRTTERSAGVALAAATLFAFAPFTAFMAGSHMNHVPTLMCIAIALASLARVMSSATSRPAWALVNGLALGATATIRPADALAFALPAALWYLTRAVRDRARWSEALSAGAGVALPVALLLWNNAQTTGSPLLFGYRLLWGPAFDMGFHAAPWGPVHTPARGLELLNLYVLRLQTYLFELPLPSLLPAIGALLLARHLHAFDRYVLASSTLLLILYFAYWHDGFYLGPRFVYPLLPALALWSARLPTLFRERFGDGFADRTLRLSLAVSAFVALGLSIPLRARQYAGSFPTMREDVAAAARTAGAKNALVLVRESWGARLVARLHALGASQLEVELLYPRVDACALEEGITHLEEGPVYGASVFAALRPLLRDSASLVPSPYSPDKSERLLPNARYTTRCLRRLEEDRTGFSILAPTLLLRSGNNVYARDLGARDSLLVTLYPNRPLYLLRHDWADSTAPARLYPVDRDSALLSWRSGS